MKLMKEIRARDPARRMVLRYRVPRQEDCSRIRLIPLILEQAALRFAQVLTKIHGFVAKSKWTNPNSRKFDQLPPRYDKLYMGRDVFFYNDATKMVEKLHQQLDTGDEELGKGGAKD